MYGSSESEIATYQASLSVSGDLDLGLRGVGSLEMHCFYLDGMLRNKSRASRRDNENQHICNIPTSFLAFVVSHFWCSAGGKYTKMMRKIPGEEV